MARGSGAANELLRFVAAVEAGRSSTDLAASGLGLRPTELRRRISALRARRWVVTQMLLDRRVLRGGFECLTRVRTDRRRPEEVGLFEASLRDDPAVVRADLVSGPWDYMLRTLHRDERGAAAWFRDLKERPAVQSADMRFVRTLLDSPHFAAALLGGAS